MHLAGGLLIDLLSRRPLVNEPKVLPIQVQGGGILRSSETPSILISTTPQLPVKETFEGAKVDALEVRVPSHIGAISARRESITSTGILTRCYGIRAR